MSAHLTLTLLPTSTSVDTTYVFPSSNDGITYKVSILDLSLFLYSTKNQILESSDYTIQTTDDKSIIVFSGSGNITLTVPNNDDQNIFNGTIIDISNNRSSGSVQVVADSGVSLGYSIGSYISNYGIASLVKINTNSWILSGDLLVS